MTTENKAVELKEGANKVTVVGTLVEKNLEEKSYTKQADGTTVEYIAGTISVRTGENEVQQIRLRANKLKKDGNENSQFKGYQTVNDINEFVSVADLEKNPELTPSEVMVTGKLTTNEYYGQDGQLRQFQQIEGRFVNRLKEKDDPTKRATFETNVFVSKVKPEIENQEETGRVVLETWIPTFNAIIPYKFSVIEQGADFFTSNVEKGQTLKVIGKLVNKKIEHVKEIEAAFGDPIREVTYDYVNEALITTASQPFEEDSKEAFNPEAIKTRLAAREVYLETQKTRANQPQQQTQAPSGFGFGVGDTAPKKDAGVAGVDLTNMF